MSSLSARTMTAPPEHARILLADHEASTGRLLISIGEIEGFGIVSAVNGLEVYRILSYDSDFKALVLDTALPDIEGVEIVRYMKADKRLMDIPIVVLAGDGSLKPISECFAAGAIAILTRPFSVEQLRGTLRMAMTGQPGPVSTVRVA